MKKKKQSEIKMWADLISVQWIYIVSMYAENIGALRARELTKNR